MQTKRLKIDFLDHLSAEMMLDYYQKNKQHLMSWEPARKESFYTVDYWGKVISDVSLSRKSGNEYRFVLLDAKQERVIGVCNYSQVVYGAFLACRLGYSIAGDYQGKGLMKEALQYTNTYMFQERGLCRIMANYLPENIRSAKLLRSLDFEKEGYARNYLKINGRWRDHVLTAKSYNKI